MAAHLQKGIDLHMVWLLRQQSEQQIQPEEGSK